MRIGRRFLQQEVLTLKVGIFEKAEDGGRLGVEALENLFEREGDTSGDQYRGVALTGA